MDKHKYLEEVTAQIRCRRARPMVKEELEAHIEDQKAEFIAQGMTLEEAEAEAVLEMGDPIEVGEKMDQLHRPKIQWGLVAFVAALSTLGIFLQITVQMVQIKVPQTGEVFKYLNDPSAYLETQIFYTGVGIIVMFIICHMDYSLISKYAVWIWIAVMLGMAAYCFVSEPVNGGYLNVKQFILVLIPVYAGIVYHYMGKGKRGLWKSILFLLVTTVISVYIPGGGPAAGVFFLIGMIVLHIAVYKNWFREKSKAMYMQLWGSVLALPAFSCICRIAVNSGRLFAPYQVARIEAMLHPLSNQSYQNMKANVAQIAESVTNGTYEKWDSWQTVLEMKSNFLWMYVFRFLGTPMGIFLTALVAVFLMFLLFVVIRQKNRLGGIIGLSCTLVLIFQAFYYIGMNFGLFPVTTGAYMPFLSWGGANLFLTYIYMGIVLSVHRNSYLIKN